MSTNSSIRIKRKDGTVTGIYCHWDGYVEAAGVTLQLAFNTADKVEELMKLGNLSSLGYYTEPKADQPHSFERPQVNVCVAYHRDRGDEFYQTVQDDEYVYTFDEAQACWYVTQEVFVRYTKACEAILLDYVVEKTTRLLLDAIIDLRDVIDSEKMWRSDEFAETGHVVAACISKAREARSVIIKEQAEERDYWNRAYCD